MKTQLNLYLFRHLYSPAFISFILLYGKYIDTTFNIIKSPLLTIQIICTSIIIQSIILYFTKYGFKISNDKMVIILKFTLYYLYHIIHILYTFTCDFVRNNISTVFKKVIIYLSLLKCLAI